MSLLLSHSLATSRIDTMDRITTGPDQLLPCAVVQLKLLIVGFVPRISSGTRPSSSSLDPALVHHILGPVSGLSGSLVSELVASVWFMVTLSLHKKQRRKATYKCGFHLMDNGRYPADAISA